MGKERRGGDLISLAGRNEGNAGGGQLWWSQEWKYFCLKRRKKKTERIFDDELMKPACTILRENDS